MYLVYVFRTLLHSATTTGAAIVVAPPPRPPFFSSFSPPPRSSFGSPSCVVFADVAQSGAGAQEECARDGDADRFPPTIYRGIRSFVGGREIVQYILGIYIVVKGSTCRLRKTSNLTYQF